MCLPSTDPTAWVYRIWDQRWPQQPCCTKHIWMSNPDRQRDRQTSMRGIVIPVIIEGVFAIYRPNCPNIRIWGQRWPRQPCCTKDICVSIPDRQTDRRTVRQTSVEGIMIPVNIKNVFAIYWSNCLSIQNLRPEVTLATLLYKEYMNINTGQTERQTDSHQWRE